MRTRIRIPPSAKRDALLLPVVYVFNCFTFSSWARLDDVLTKPWLLLPWLCGLAGLVPLFWRDRAPMTVVATQWVLTVTTWPIMYYYTPFAGIPVALYTVSTHRSRKMSLLATVACSIPNGLAAAVAFQAYDDSGTQLRAFLGNLVFLTVLTVGAWTAGRLTQARRRHIHQLESEQVTNREAVAAERRRIARELHDIVSHAVTIIVLQAAGAARLVDTDLARVVQSLGHIETTGKQAMAELRRLLAVLDAGEPGSVADVGGELGPQPGLENLPALLSSLQAAGRAVTTRTEGTPGELDPSVNLTAYRIVQEGLTNVLKHAGHNPNPRLRLHWETHHLLIQIDNDIHPAPPRHGEALSTGRGLLGLRERTNATGGHLHAGTHHNGYRLTATLPLADTAQLSQTDHFP